jgi:hypothetical protein
LILSSPNSFSLFLTDIIQMAQKQNHSTPSEKAAALRAAKLQNVKASATAMQEDPSASM